MAARETLSDLIAELRVTIGDSAGNSAVFTDEDLQRFLDRNARESSFDKLIAKPEKNSNGWQYFKHTAPAPYWEKSAKFYDYASNLIVANNSSDFLTGKWYFDASYSSVYIVGSFFDLNAAAADAFEAWAAKEKLNFDFSADGQSYKESQKVQTLLQMAKEYRGKSTFVVGTASYSSGDWN